MWHRLLRRTLQRIIIAELCNAVQVSDTIKAEQKIIAGE